MSEHQVRHHGWYWWTGPGNDRRVDGSRPHCEKQWVVMCWSLGGVGYASSANWVLPLTQEDMGRTGTWGPEVISPARLL